MLFVCALVLRWYRLPETMGWWGDVAADHIVSEHIIRYGELPIVGHPATGLSPAFYYPPYFYYLMAVVKFFSVDPVIVAALASALHAAAVLPLFALGTMLAHPLVGIVAAALFVASSRMVNISQVTTPPYVLVPVLLFVFWGYVVSYRQRHVPLRWGLHAALVLLSSWFYGILIFLPLAWMLDIIAAKHTRQRMITTGVFVFFGMVLFAPLMWHFGVIRVVGAFLFTHHVRFAFASVLEFWKPLAVTFTDLFFYDQQRSIVAATALTVFGLFSWEGIRRYRRNLIVTGILVLYYLTFALGLGRLPHDHDVHIIQPILLLGIAGIMVSAWHHQRQGIGKIGVLIAGGFFFFLLMQPPVFTKPVADQFGVTRKTAEYILTDVRQNPLPGTSAYTVSVLAPGEMTNDHLAFLYWIETITGKQVLKVVPDGFNVVEMVPGGRRYVVCLRYPAEFMAKQCLEDAALSYPQYRPVRHIPLDMGDRMIYVFTSDLDE